MVVFRGRKGAREERSTRDPPHRQPTSSKIPPKPRPTYGDVYGSTSSPILKLVCGALALGLFYAGTQSELFSSTLLISAKSTAPVFDPHKNRTVVLLYGPLAENDCGEAAHASLYQNVLDANSADLALFVPKGTRDESSSSLLQRANYVWEYQDYQNWGEALDLVNRNWRSVVLPKLSDEARSGGLLGGVVGLHGTGARDAVLQYWLKHRIRSNHLHVQYNRFIIAAPNQYYECKFDVSLLNPFHVWTMDGNENDEGINHRMLVASGDQIGALLDAINVYLNKFDEQTYENVVNTETLLEATLLRYDLPFKSSERTMYSCTADAATGGFLAESADEKQMAADTCIHGPPKILEIDDSEDDDTDEDEDSEDEEESSDDESEETK